MTTKAELIDAVDRLDFAVDAIRDIPEDQLPAGEATRLTRYLKEAAGRIGLSVSRILGPSDQEPAATETE